MLKHTTLWEILVKRFYAEYFTDMATRTAKAIAFNLGATEDDLSKIIDYEHPGVKELAEKLKDYEQEFKKLDLDMSAKTLSRLIDVLTNQKSTYSDFNELIKQLEGRITDELRLRKFFCIERDKESFLLEKDSFGAMVTSAFPSATIDIEEAGKCLAFERWTASVFHLSRVAEIAAVSIGKRIGYQSHKEGFGEVLNYMDTQLEKARRNYKGASKLFKGDIAFLSAVTAQMHAVNQAWRQRVAHLDTKYTEEEALRIWFATKGLMEQIAEKLTEENV